jgi:hypothetical protein
VYHLTPIEVYNATVGHIQQLFDLEYFSPNEDHPAAVIVSNTHGILFSNLKHKQSVLLVTVIEQEWKVEVNEKQLWNFMKTGL